MSQDILQRLKSFKKSHHGTGKGLRYSTSEMQGWRNEMEDAHCEITKTSKIDGWSFFAIFDGHGGSLCSKESASML
jgi:serine/threonine protein phosphatase PrpC